MQQFYAMSASGRVYKFCCKKDADVWIAEGANRRRLTVAELTTRQQKIKRNRNYGLGEY